MLINKAYTHTEIFYIRHLLKFRDYIARFVFGFVIVKIVENAGLLIGYYLSILLRFHLDETEKPQTEKLSDKSASHLANPLKNYELVKLCEKQKLSLNSNQLLEERWRTFFKLPHKWLVAFCAQKGYPQMLSKHKAKQCQANFSGLAQGKLIRVPTNVEVAFIRSLFINGILHQIFIVIVQTQISSTI